MKSFVSFLVLLAALGCRTGEFQPGLAAITTTSNGVASLSSAKSLTLRSAGSDWLDFGHSGDQREKPEDATRTVLEVERGCVLVSVAKLPLNSVFEIRGGEVVAQVRGTECAAGADGTVVVVSEPVSLAAGEKSLVRRETACLDAKNEQNAGASSASPAFGWAESLSPYERGLARARHGWY